MHLAAILSRAEDLWPDREAVVCGEARLTYREFAARCRRLANHLRSDGLDVGDRVAILSPNCHVFLEAYFAAALAGLVLVPVNVRLHPREVAEILADSGAALVLGASDAAPSLGFGDPYEAALARADDGALPRSPGGDAPAQIYYTSGTTGAPKGVVLTHRNVWSHALGAIAELQITDADVWLHAAPLYHLADAWATFAITMAGGRHVLCRKFEAARVLGLVREEGVTITNLVPTMLGDLVNAPEAAAAPFPALRRLLSGGAPIAPALVRRITDTFGCDYVQTYGMTETSPYLTLSLLKEHLRNRPEEEHFARIASTGRAFVTVELRVADEDGREVPRDGKAVGEILVRGPSVTPGYWNRPAETAAAFDDGWLRTGDLATIDAEGYVNIVDRKKDVILTGGETVYSTEVEYALMEHPAVREAAVIGLPHDRWGETVHAAVALTAGSAATAEDLARFLRDRIAAFKIPRTFAIVDALPRTGSGKIAKRLLRPDGQASQSGSG